MKKLTIFDAIGIFIITSLLTAATITIVYNIKKVIEYNKKPKSILLNEYFNYTEDSLQLNPTQISTYFYLSKSKKDSLYSDALNKMSEIIFLDKVIFNK